MNSNLALELLRQYGDFRWSNHLIDVEGMSSARIRNFLNALVRHMDESEHYLEIGTWRGRTLLSAAFENTGRTCYACDKFRIYGRWTGWGFQARQALKRNIDRYREQLAEIRFFHMSSQRLFREQQVPEGVGVYFYDGDHSCEMTRQSIVDATPLLARRSVLLVDDWNAEQVRRGARQGIGEGRLRVVWERELWGDRTDTGWWNGLGVFYLERYV